MEALGATLAPEALDVHVLGMTVRIVRYCGLPHVPKMLVERGCLKTVGEE